MNPKSAAISASANPTAASAGTAASDMPSFNVIAHNGGRDLEIEATLPSPAGTRLSVDNDATSGLEDPTVLTDGHWLPLRRADDGSDRILPACHPSPCRVRYRFALGDVARSLNDPETASGRNGAFFAPSTTWALLPDVNVVPAHRYHVQMDTGVFASGADPGPNAGDYVQTETDLAAPFAVFGAFRMQSFVVGNAKVDLAIGPGKLALSDALLLDLLKRTVARIADYDGVFPAPHVLVILLPGGHDGNGVTLGGGGASVLMHVPHDATEAMIENAWVPTHELLHVAFCSVGMPYRWMEEGLSTYLEPVVRGRAGVVGEKDFWTDLVKGLPQGEPAAGSAGLNASHDWGSTYWGGALFWLKADLEIRRRTNGKKSLRDALHAIAAQGAFVGQHWPIERVLDVGDRGAGVPVLHETYAAMALKAGPVDLDALWKSLGISLGPSGAIFDDHAPEAVFRRQIPRGEP